MSLGSKPSKALGDAVALCYLATVGWGVERSRHHPYPYPFLETDVLDATIVEATIGIFSRDLTCPWGSHLQMALKGA